MKKEFEKCLTCENINDHTFIGDYCLSCTQKNVKKSQIGVNSVVQVNTELDEKDNKFAGCFVVVTELKPWGIQGYAQNVGAKGQIYIRLNWEQIEYIGEAEWVIE